MKAILLIDMPESCGKCKFLMPPDEIDYDDSYYGGEHLSEYCLPMEEENRKFKGARFITDGKRPSWCPLKPIPEKKQEYLYKQTINGIEAPEVIDWNRGYNACLDSIIGENNESSISN